MNDTGLIITTNQGPTMNHRNKTALMLRQEIRHLQDEKSKLQTQCIDLRADLYLQERMVKYHRRNTEQANERVNAHIAKERRTIIYMVVIAVVACGAAFM